MMSNSAGPTCRVLILQRGRVVYFGDNGDAATTYFTQTLSEVHPLAHQCAPPLLLDLAIVMYADCYLQSYRGSGFLMCAACLLVSTLG